MASLFKRLLDQMWITYGSIYWEGVACLDASLQIKRTCINGARYGNAQLLCRRITQLWTATLSSLKCTHFMVAEW